MATDARFSLTFQTRSAARIRTASRSHVTGRTDSCVTISYFNRTDRAISITERDGTVSVLQPKAGPATDEIIVCVSRLMQRDTMERALEVLKADVIGDNVERDQWIRAYEAALFNATNLSLEASVEYVIYYRDLIDAGGRCYMPDLDLLIEWLSDRGAEHPFARGQRNRATMEAIVPEVSDDTFVMMIKAVDNSPTSSRSDRFINIGGDIYRVPIEKDVSYATGVHLVTRRPIRDGVAGSGTLQRSFGFDEADKMFSLHRNVEDARNGGPIEAMAKNMVDHLTAVKKVDEARMRADQTAEEQRLQQIRNEGAILKAVQEKEAASRRNYVEWAKTAAALLGSAITIYGIWSKFIASKK